MLFSSQPIEFSGPVDLGTAIRLLLVNATNTIFSGAIGGSPGAGLAATGPGVLTLSHANTFDGGLTLTSAGGNLPTLVLNDAQAAGTGTLTLGSGTLKLGPGLSGAQAVRNPVALRGAVMIRSDQDIFVDELAGDLDLGSAARSIDVSSSRAGQLVLSGNITGSDTAPLTLTTSSGGLIVLPRANAFSGGTFLNGSFRIGHEAAFGTGPIQFTAATIQADANLTGLRAVANSGKLVTLSTAGTNALEFSGNLGLGSYVQVVLGNTGGLIFSGTLSDTTAAGQLVVLGTGQLTLSGANLYTGGTSVNNQTMVIGNTTGSATGPGPVDVNRGTLTGAGTLAGPTTIGNDNSYGQAFLSPGKASGNSPRERFH